MTTENQLLVGLLVKIAVITSMASLMTRWTFVRRLLLVEQRTAYQRLVLGLVFGGLLAGGTLVRHIPSGGYQAAELGLEGALLAGLVAGYVTGAITSLLVAIPSMLLAPHEWLSLPLLLGVSALGGLLRDFAPDAEDFWSISPFAPFSGSFWKRAGSPGGAFQLLLLGSCIAVLFIYSSLAKAFESSQLLFSMYRPDPSLSPATVAAAYVSTVLCVALTLKVWNNTRNEWKLGEQRRLLAEARLRALTSQINPHFLFNTLNSVSSLIRSNPDEARRMVFKLSTILRRLLRQHEAFTPLREELGFLDDYLAIETIRFGEKLTIRKEIEPEALDALLPSMLLQPIIENSIKHGITPKVGPGTIWIRMAVQGRRLQIEIEDDGAGIEPEKLPEVFQSGVGFSNVYERLRVLFAEDFHLTIEPRPAGGTRVRIQLPRLAVAEPVPA